MDTIIRQKQDWLFILLGKGTPYVGWWLKLTSDEELISYLAHMDTRWKNTYENFLKDKYYQTSLITHGPHIKEAPITFAVWLRGMNRRQSFMSVLTSLMEENAIAMSEHIKHNGYVLVNRKGGWCPTKEQSDDFCHKKELSWPDFSEDDIVISQFPGGTHWYARVGNVNVKFGQNRKFYTYEDAKKAADIYCTNKKR